MGKLRNNINLLLDDYRRRLKTCVQFEDKLNGKDELTSNEKKQYERIETKKYAYKNFVYELESILKKY